MKKILQSKSFIAIALVILCVIIIIACLIAGRSKNSEFMPVDTSGIDNAVEGSINASSATEMPQATAEGINATAYLPTPTTSNRDEAYPKVVSKTDDEVLIEFTSTEKSTETTPPAPEGTTIIEDPGPNHPVNVNPEITAPATEAPTTAAPTTEAPPSTQPENGSGNSNSAVYDPVFGWVEPGVVEQSSITSDGDPNKMVGNMGE